MKRLCCGTLIYIGLVCGLLGAPVATPSSSDAVPFEIRSIQRATKPQAYVENAWKRNVAGVEVSLRTLKDEGSKTAWVNATFYNKDKEEVAKFLQPVQYTQTGTSAISKPDFFKPREYYSVFFPLTDRAKEGKDRWTRVVVVFGEGKQAVADIYPHDDIAPYKFSGKEFAVVKAK